MLSSTLRNLIGIPSRCSWFPHLHFDEQRKIVPMWVLAWLLCRCGATSSPSTVLSRYNIRRILRRAHGAHVANADRAALKAMKLTGPLTYDVPMQLHDDCRDSLAPLMHTLAKVVPPLHMRCRARPVACTGPSRSNLVLSVHSSLPPRYIKMNFCLHHRAQISEQYALCLQVTSQGVTACSFKCFLVAGL